LQEAPPDNGDLFNLHNQLHREVACPSQTHACPIHPCEKNNNYVSYNKQPGLG